MSKKAFVIVDVQRDFCKGGSLEVPNGDEVVDVCNKLRKIKWDLIVLSQDYHPKNHSSFASNNDEAKPFSMKEVFGINQVMWPDHCVQATDGCEFHKDLKVSKSDVVVRKGMNWKVDSYSAFLENDKKSKTSLDETLKKNKIEEVYVCGLAYDYCVKYTAVDGANFGYKVFFIEDASRGLDVEGCKTAKKEMEEKGIKFINSKDLL